LALIVQIIARAAYSGHVLKQRATGIQMLAAAPSMAFTDKLCRFPPCIAAKAVTEAEETALPCIHKRKTS